MTATTGLEQVNADILRLRRANGSIDDVDALLTTIDAAIVSANTILTAICTVL